MPTIAVIGTIVPFQKTNDYFVDKNQAIIKNYPEITRINEIRSDITSKFDIMFNHAFVVVKNLKGYFVVLKRAFIHTLV